VFDFVQQHVSGSPLTYLLIVGVCAGDALLPLFPSEAIVITAGVLAANGRLEIAFVVLASWLGAVIGDNSAYGLGRSGLRRLADRLLGSESNQRRLRWARDQLRSSGAWIIIVARFIPGGRTATTYAAGTLEMPWKRRFLPADTTAGLIWSLFSASLGYFGGAAFEDNLIVPLAIATGASLIVAGAGELLRRTVLDRRNMKG
jgi:membrane protein DedA with SNARE-associated domain